MIEREILIANTKTQRRSKVTTNATTLGELKSALDAAGIDYSGMTFTEGISKTQLLDDATQLPQNVMYKGQPTNNLVILLTNTKKNIASGIHAADRQAAYSIIKERGLQEEIKETFGRNFTQVPTADLQNFIEDRTESDADDYDDEDYEDYDDEEEEDDDYTDANDCDVNFAQAVGREIAESIVASINNLVSIGKILPEDVKYIVDSLGGKNGIKSESISTTDGSINNDDITNLIKELNM